MLMHCYIQLTRYCFADDHVAKISNAVDINQEMAEQTNLLTLNAAIMANVVNDIVYCNEHGVNIVDLLNISEDEWDIC